MNEVPDTVTVQVEDRRLFVKRKPCVQVLNDLSHLTLLFVCNAAKKKTTKKKHKKTNSKNNQTKTKPPK